MKSRLLDSPTLNRNNTLRIDKINDIKTPLDNGTLIPANDYILPNDAEYLESKRIANIFLRLPCSFYCEDSEFYPDMYD